MHHLTAIPILVALSLLIGTVACSSGTQEGGTPEETASASAAIVATPCAFVPNQDDGLFCGHSTEEGFDTSLANPNWLYACEDHTVVGVTHCANGCTVEPSGVADRCN